MKSGFKVGLKQIYSVISLAAFFYFSTQISLNFANHELKRIGVPGSLHQLLTAHSFQLDRQDISRLKTWQRIIAVSHYIQKRGDNI